MKILLVDIDSKIPNLALMKLSFFYKSKGCQVDLIRLSYNGYTSKRGITVIKNKKYDKTLVSVIFKVNKNNFGFEKIEGVEIGGTGVNTIALPSDIDNTEEDYSIYPNNKSSFGFITRGCPRKCGFCVVPEKEGLLYKYRNISDIVKHKRVFFMDNNILAYSKHKEVFQELINKNIRCQFNQGLDLRLVDNENARMLSELNYMGEYTFAFDSVALEKKLNTKIKIVKEYIKKDWKIRMFILGGYDSTIDEDLYRIYWCIKRKVKPYFMRHENCWASEDKNLYISMATYYNLPAIFKSMTFSEFMIKRTNNKTRAHSDINRFNFFYNKMLKLNINNSSK